MWTKAARFCSDEEQFQVTWCFWKQFFSPEKINGSRKNVAWHKKLCYLKCGKLEWFSPWCRIRNINAINDMGVRGTTMTTMATATTVSLVSRMASASFAMLGLAVNSVNAVPLLLRLFDFQLHWPMDASKHQCIHVHSPGWWWPWWQAVLHLGIW